ncbi:UvrD-helicase domain-containing protein [Streptomonospora arabica]|uniref:UvrD-helicase domain-containing protein n=1 Tax=Streptomonospora arabica TaxID=412417 RepID=A0ABV9SKH1_9ACTN
MSNRLGKDDTEADKAIRALLDDDRKSAFIVMAGAGSGKTTSLVKALDHLGRTQGPRLRRGGRRIACITYTNNAVEEIREDIGTDGCFHVSTIHSFLWEVARPFQGAMRQWMRHRVGELIRDKQERNARPRTRAATRVANDRAIRRLREDLEKLQDPDLRLTYGAAQDYGRGILGHSDILRMVPELIERHPNLAAITAQAFPYLLVDESQDTTAAAVSAFTAIERSEQGRFCLGFFGDPMQQVYGIGAGTVEPASDWTVIRKPENWRCPRLILEVINTIRSQSATDDGLQQIPGPGGPTMPGHADLFVLDQEGDDETQLAQVRSYLAREQQDPAWTENHDEAVKVLVLEHRLAARRLGFEQLYDSFATAQRERERFAEGTHWALKPFLERIIPLAEAVRDQEGVAAMALLRRYSRSLDAFVEGTSSVEVLPQLKRDAATLADLLSEGSQATVREVLEHLAKTGLIRLDRRLLPHLRRDDDTLAIADHFPEDGGEENGQTGERDSEKLEAVITAYLGCPARQVVSYRDYIEGRTSYQTQQGVKGAEFPRVLVLLEDDRSKGTNFSYEKLFGLKDLTETDIQNKELGKDNTLERTLRLFYVSCSRATRSLAVVLFTKDTETARDRLRRDGPFMAEKVHDAP